MPMGVVLRKTYLRGERIDGEPWLVAFSDFHSVDTSTTPDFKLLLLLSHFSCARLCATPETAAHQAPPSLGLITSLKNLQNVTIGSHDPEGATAFESSRQTQYVKQETV